MTTTSAINEHLVDILFSLGEDEKALRWTSSRGRWEAIRDYARGERGKIVHRPTGDRLGGFDAPADAEHAVRWQPARIQHLIDAKRALILALSSPHVQTRDALVDKVLDYLAADMHPREV